MGAELRRLVRERAGNRCEYCGMRQQFDARLVGAIQVSEDERRDLIRRRAEAVQAAIPKTGKIAAERLFISTPKPGSPAAKGETRANLSLS